MAWGGSACRNPAFGAGRLFLGLRRHAVPCDSFPARKAPTNEENEFLLGYFDFTCIHGVLIWTICSFVYFHFISLLFKQKSLFYYFGCAMCFNHRHGDMGTRSNHIACVSTDLCLLTQLAATPPSYLLHSILVDKFSLVVVYFE